MEELGIHNIYCIPALSHRYHNYFNSDYLFLNEGDFVYDPDYNHWNEINEPRDFQFETDFVTMKDSRKKVF